MQAINFSSLTALKIFNAFNTGAEQGLATPVTTAASVSFDKNCVYLDAERLYEHIKQETFQTCTPLPLAPGTSQMHAEIVQVKRSFKTTVNCSQMRFCQAIYQ